MSVLKTYGGDTSFHPSLTYQINGNRIEGKIDGILAVMQAVQLILETERYQYPVYSWDYGVEISELIGKDKRYLEADLKRQITEALAQDDRISGVENFSLNYTGDSASVTFTVISIFGNFEVERGMELVRGI